jgi:hypothetical protein
MSRRLAYPTPQRTAKSIGTHVSTTTAGPVSVHGSALFNQREHMGLPQLTRVGRLPPFERSLAQLEQQQFPCGRMQAPYARFNLAPSGGRRKDERRGFLDGEAVALAQCSYFFRPRVIS